jgi:hypothetical protein
VSPLQISPAPSLLTLLFSTEKMLEDSGDSVAPPPRRRAAAPAAILPDRPAFAESTPPPENVAEEESLDVDEDNSDEADRDIVHPDAGAGSDADVDADADANHADANANSDAEATKGHDDEANAAAVLDEANAAEEAELAADPDADVDMDGEDRTPSPELQGASRTTGGTIRGRAPGNVFNFADADNNAAPEQVWSRVMGRVLVYDDRSLGAEPYFTIKNEVTPSLKAVLMHLNEKHSPIRSKDSPHYRIQHRLTILRE